MAPHLSTLVVTLQFTATACLSKTSNVIVFILNILMAIFPMQINNSNFTRCLPLCTTTTYNTTVDQRMLNISFMIIDRLLMSNCQSGSLTRHLEGTHFSRMEWMHSYSQTITFLPPPRSGNRSSDTFCSMPTLVSFPAPVCPLRTNVFLLFSPGFLSVFFVVKSRFTCSPDIFPILCKPIIISRLFKLASPFSFLVYACRVCHVTKSVSDVHMPLFRASCDTLCVLFDRVLALQHSHSWFNSSLNRLWH